MKNDYYIIDVRSYTSPYYLKKFEKGEHIGVVKQYESAKAYNKFFWDFIEKVNGKTPADYYKLYTSATECAIEEIHETHNIRIFNKEARYQYIIPKLNNEELFEWIKDNAPKYKILSRTCSFWYETKPTTWKREHFKHSDKYLEMIKDIEW